MFKNSCSEKNWNRLMITDQHILALRTESPPSDELNKRVVLSDTGAAMSSNPQEQTEKLKNQVLIEPSLNQKGSPRLRKMDQLPAQRHGWFPPCCLVFHFLFFIFF